MASLETNTIAATYVGLLKTADNAVRGAEGSADQCSDGAGNTIPLYVSATEVYAVGSGTGTSHTAFGKDCGVDLAAGTGNSLFGEGAGADITTGEHNVAVGYHALYQGTTETDDNVAIGYNSMSGGWTTATVTQNVAVGSGTLAGVMTDAADNNVAVGYNALNALTTGSGNAVIGQGAATLLTTGQDNVAIGRIALGASVAGMTDNIAIGANAMGNANHASSDNNVAIGGSALASIGTNANEKNVAIGHESLTALTTGAANTAVGANAGDALLGGGNNVMMGIHAGGSATTVNKAVLIGYYAGGRAAMTGGVDADGTICIGADSGASLTEGQFNTIVGYESGYALVDGDANVLMGYQAGDSLTSSGHNVIIGYQSMATATSGTDSCVAIGYQAMNGGHTTANLDDVVAIGKLAAGGGTLTAGAEGTVAIGREALENLTSGGGNVAVGYFALTGVTTGAGNTALGHNSLTTNVDGGYNTAVGWNSLLYFEAGSLNAGANTVMGAQAGKFVSTGTSNVFIGADAGLGVTGTRLTGANNTAVGQNSGVLLRGAATGNVLLGQGAGAAIQAGTNNTCIGQGSDPSAHGGTNQTVVGYGATGQADNSVTLGNADVTATYLASGASDANILYIGDTANAKMTVGLTINQGATDNEILAFKSSDIAHGMTDRAETDTYGTLTKAGANDGGLKIEGFADTSNNGILLIGSSPADVDTKGTGSYGVLRMRANKTNSATVQACGSNANLVTIDNNGTTRFIFDAEGDSHQDVGTAWTNFDNENDAMISRSLGVVMNPDTIIGTKWDDWGRDHKEDLVRCGIMPEITPEQIKKGERPLVNTTQVMRLHNGAIWQQYTEMQKMKELMYDTMVELIGKEKADAKLKDHDIKLLNENTLLN
jgi:hypothetical protein